MSEESQVLQPSELHQLLDRLCTQLGFCLPPADQVRLAEHPPQTAEAFTDAVFEAEGLDPATADRHPYRQVRKLVRETFRRVRQEREPGPGR
jgi:hypothetical protein